MPQTQTYAQLLTDVQALAGETLTTTEQTRLKGLVNMRARLAFNQCDYWPTFLHVNEPRRVRSSFYEYTHSQPDDPADTTYTSDSSARSFGSEEGPTAAPSEVGKNTNQDYLLLEEVDLDYSGTAKDIDTVHRVFLSDPFRSKSVAEAHFSIDNEKVLLVGENNVYARMRLPNEVSSVSAVGGNITVNFAVDYHGFRRWDQYYIDPDFLTETTSSGLVLGGPYVVTGSGQGSGAFITTSATYSGLASTVSTFTASRLAVQVPCVFLTYKEQLPTYGDGEGETSNVPKEFYQYLVRGVYADYLRSDGQTEKAMAEDVNAQSVLDLELERVERTQNHPNLFTRFQSHGVETVRQY